MKSIPLEDIARLDRLYRQWVGSGELDLKRLYQAIWREHQFQKKNPDKVSRQLTRKTRGELNFVGKALRMSRESNPARGSAEKRKQLEDRYFKLGYKKRYPMDEIVYSEIEEVDGSRESNPGRRAHSRKARGSSKIQRIWDKIRTGKPLTYAEETAWRNRAYTDTDYPKRAGNPAGRVAPITLLTDSSIKSMIEDFRKPKWRKSERDAEFARSSIAGLEAELARRGGKRVGNPAPAISAAKRGDLFVDEAHSNYVLARGGHVSNVHFTLCKVLGVTREGRVKIWNEVGSISAPHKSIPAKLWIISQNTINVPAAEAAYVTRGKDSYSSERPFKTLEEAKDFLRRFLK